jgi:SAM-dependent methyltransferase
MTDERELDATARVVREKLRQSRTQKEAPTSAPLTEDLRNLHALYDILRAPFTFHRRVLGRLLLPLRWMVKELLTPVIARQVSYNAANTRLVDDLKTRLDALQASATLLAHRHRELERLVPEALAEANEQFHKQSRALARAFTDSYAGDREVSEHAWRELNERFDGQAREIERLEQGGRETTCKLGSEVGELRKLLEDLSAQTGSEAKSFVARLARLERHLRRTGVAEASRAGEHGALPVESRALDPAIDYFEFHEKFRGAQSGLRERQAIYEPYFRNRRPLVDLGCGRGEFLELMRHNGAGVVGVDSNPDMAHYCRGRGLEVVQADANAYLAGQADESLGAIFSAQVAEHLSAMELARMLTLAGRKLRRDGLLIIETLNPDSLWVQYRWFWMDPTHTRLVHPQTLQFLFDAAGFDKVQCHLLPPPPGPRLLPPLPAAVAGSEEFNRATAYLNEVLFGSQEYFVAGTRAAD